MANHEDSRELPFPGRVQSDSPADGGRCPLTSSTGAPKEGSHEPPPGTPSGGDEPAHVIRDSERGVPITSHDGAREIGAVWNAETRRRVAEFFRLLDEIDRRTRAPSKERRAA